MFDDMAQKVAKVAVEYSVAVQPGDFVYITTSAQAAPLVEAMFEHLIKAGAHVQTNWGHPPLQEIFLRHATDDQITWINPTTEVIMSQADVYMVLGAETNPKALTTYDPTILQRQQQAYQDIYRTFMERMGTGDLRYYYTLWPTNAAAQQAEMGLLAYTEFVYNACGLQHDDPPAYWHEFHDRQQKLVDWLADKKHAKVTGPGVDLEFDFADRKWINCDGKLNFPDGEIFTGPIEDSVNGRVEFSYPSLYGGQEVEGVKLTFNDGVVTEASADKGESMLLAQLDVDEGAKRLGEFAIGTNYGVTQYTGNTLFDEKIGGTIHMALGNSIHESGGVNQSSIHWDIVHEMKEGGEIHIDGELFYKDGQFVID